MRDQGSALMIPLSVHPKLSRLIMGSGYDKYTHMLLLRGVDGSVRVLAPVNVDGRAKVRGETRTIELVDGTYWCCAHYHHWDRGTYHPAFYILKAPPSKASTLRSLYDSPLRKAMLTTSGESFDYFNFHRGGYDSDWSEGCWTAPQKLFDKFRATFRDLDYFKIQKGGQYDEADLQAGLNALLKK